MRREFGWAAVYVILCFFCLGVGQSALATADGLLLYGNAGQVHLKNSRSPGGYGQAGWGVKKGAFLWAGTISSRRFINYKPKENSLKSYTLDLESLGFEVEARQGSLSFIVTADVGRVTTEIEESTRRDPFYGVQVGVGVCFFRNDFIRLHGRLGAFQIMPHKGLREDLGFGRIDGGFVAIGMDLAEPEKDF